jgi:hypothetical protein
VIGLYWKKYIGWVALGYLILSTIWCGQWVVLYIISGSASTLLEIFFYLVESYPYFIGYQISHLILSLTIFWLLLVEQQVTLKRYNKAVLFAILLVVIDLIPFVEQGIRLSFGANQETPFTAILMLFHLFLLFQLWWYKKKVLEQNPVTLAYEGSGDGVMGTS